MRIALIGTRGVPPRYGGFETAVDEIGSRLVRRGHEVTVYCRNPGQVIESYRGMRLVNLPALRQRSAETLSHTGATVAHIARHSPRPDIAMVFNAANAPYIRPLRSMGIPVAIHLDGLESQRPKWEGLGSRYFRWAESASVRWADEVIADSEEIVSQVARAHGRRPTYIPYGASLITPGSQRLHEIGLVDDGYLLVVARFEPENQLLEIARAFHASAATLPLAMIGDSPYSKAYVGAVREVAERDARISILGSVYDQELLDQVYGHARRYIHGHSVGGTNPSLLRAMGAGSAILSYDVSYNREVLDDAAVFWRSPEELTRLIDAAGAAGERNEWQARRDEARARVAAHYQWDDVASAYETLAQRMVARRD